MTLISGDLRAEDRPDKPYAIASFTASKPTTKPLIFTGVEAAWLDGKPLDIQDGQCSTPIPAAGPARACLGLGMPLQLRFYNHGTLSTSQPVHNSSDPSWCAERGSDADPCHRIAARPSPQTSTAPRHPWTSFAFCSLRRGPT
jgi:hypothetical protein